MLGEVVLQLLGRHDDGVEEFLCLWVMWLGVSQYLADKIHGTLDLKGVSLFFPFNYQSGADHMVSGCQVKQKGFAGIRCHEHRWRGQESLEAVEGCLCLLRPDKGVGFLEEFVQRQASLSQPCDESAEHC